MVKMAAARANFECASNSAGDPARASRRRAGADRRQAARRVPLDVFQGGAGTSTNMNANEVIANRALELMGHKKGEYKHCDPHDHVNGSQSTNDAYPSSLHVGMALGNMQLVAAVNELIAAFRAKGKEFARSEDGPHAAAGRRADDARPGVRSVRGDARGEVQALQRSSACCAKTNMGATPSAPG
jgi:aspartate ammonia-lyase